MSRFNIMPRAYRRQLANQDEQAVQRAIGDGLYDEAWGPDGHPTYHAGATSPGDARRLRGIPAIGPSVTGAIPGTRPGDSLWR